MMVRRLDGHSNTIQLIVFPCLHLNTKFHLYWIEILCLFDRLLDFKTLRRGYCSVNEGFFCHNS